MTAEQARRYQIGLGLVFGTVGLAAVALGAVRLARRSPAADRMLERVIELKKSGDSAGGIVSCRVTGLGAGLGEPVFDKLDALLADGAVPGGSDAA